MAKHIKAIRIDREQNEALVLVLEAVALCMMASGSTREEAINDASVLFAHAHAQANMLQLEADFADGND